MTRVAIGNLLWFSANDGVTLEKAATDADPIVLRDAVRLAFAHMNDPLLMDACCGGSGPLADTGDLTFDEYLALTERYTKIDLTTH